MTLLRIPMNVSVGLVMLHVRGISKPPSPIRHKQTNLSCVGWRALVSHAFWYLLLYYTHGLDTTRSKIQPRIVTIKKNIHPTDKFSFVFLHTPIRDEDCDNHLP